VIWQRRRIPKTARGAADEAQHDGCRVDGSHHFDAACLVTSMLRAFLSDGRKR
jgi:hypothetical protein